MRFVYIFILPLLLIPIGKPSGELSTNKVVLADTTLTQKTATKITIPTTPKKTTTQTTKTTTSKQKSAKNTDNTTTSTKKSQTTKKSKKESTKQQTASTPKSSPVVENTSTSNATSISSVEQEVARLVNVERAKQGIQPLTLNSKLSMIAEKKSQDMKDNNYFSHQSPTYGSPFDMLNQFGVSYQTAGENIAAGYPTAKTVVEGWMNSQGHRENILNPAFTKIGVGYVSGGSQNGYWTQIFTG